MMEVVTKPLAELHEISKNVRKHTDKQLKEYVRSLKMFGQIKPIVVDEYGEIIAGNGLYAALKSMGAETCECYVVAGLTATQKKKLMLADNRVYELGITDTDMFDEIIKELGGDIDVPGWDADLLEMLTSSVAEANDIVESYGTYQPEDVATVNSREREDHAVAAVPAPAASTPADNAASTQSERYVICPKCGERICL